MHRSYSLIATVLLCAIILAAGCTQNAGKSAGATLPTTAPVQDLTTLGLSPSEVPDGYVLSDSRVKQPEDMNKFALDLGWQGGYAIHFVKPSSNPLTISEILQSVAVYPASNIKELLTYAVNGEKSDKDMIFTDLPSPGIGDYSNAFSGKASAQFIVKPEENNPLSGKIGTTETVAKKDFVEIVFSKGNTFEVFRMSGPDANYTILKGLAETAYQKIA